MSDKREAIVALHHARKSHSTIAKTLSIAKSTLKKVIYLIIQEVVV